MVNSNLRINMTGTESDPNARAKRYQTAIDMAAYADQQGFSSVNVEEHHLAVNGWLPSPITMAAAIAGRTDHIGIGVMALLVSLYDPIRLAEDLAILDLLSEGRLNFVAGMGYRDIEFHAMDKPYQERGAWMDHVLETLLAAWREEPFEYRGKMINVTPKPFTQPHPTFLVGGMSKPAARRAARLGLPFCPPISTPVLEDYYYEQLNKYQQQGFVYSPEADFSLLFIDENPDINVKDLKRDLYVACNTMLEHEDAFIDRAFELGNVEGLRPEEVKKYIRHIACLLYTSDAADE